jgi:energy-coupling factor transporter ATP-binding protein EcfA2
MSRTVIGWDIGNAQRASVQNLLGSAPPPVQTVTRGLRTGSAAEPVSSCNAKLASSLAVYEEPISVTTALPPAWPVCRIDVNDLFGSRSLSFELEESTTLLTGENGSGKSTVLRAVHLASCGQWARFNQLPLREVGLLFRDGLQLRVTNLDEGELRVEGFGSVWDVDLHSLDPMDPRRRRELSILRARMERAEHETERLALMSQLNRLRARHDFLETPDWVSEALSRVSTKLISARRLEHRLRPDRVGEHDAPPEPVVNTYAREMRDRMRDELSRYAAASQPQEKNLPTRIVRAMQEGADADPEILAREVETLRADVRDLAALLSRVGLFDEEEGPDQFEGYPRDNAPILLAVREVYQVAQDRFSRLTELRRELDLFATFINDRFSDKHIELNKTNGIEVVLGDRQRIPPSALSSGEQHLLALAYDLLFGTAPYSVVLLDEPELSLHVGWLKGLISAFADMGNQRQLQFLIATHSPSILAGHLHRERSLDVL